MSAKTVKAPKTRRLTTVDEAVDQWEKGELGRDEQYAKVADVDGAKIDKAIDLVQISIRLQRSLIQDYKYIAELNGIGYQTLMRQILTRFAESEKKNILREAALYQRELVEKERHDDDQPKRKRA